MGWLSNITKKDDAPASSWSEPISTLLQPVRQELQKHDIVDLDRWERAVLHDSYVLTTIGCVGAASFLLGLRVGRTRPSRLQRWTNMADVPSALIGAEAPFLRGRVVSVSDGDTIRFLHVPTRLFHSSRLDTTTQKLSDVALPIRICTIDTPETAKFGKQGQPFGPEAKDYLASMADQKMVQLRILTKDQYGRGVAEVRVPTFLGLFWNYVDEQMLKAGLAEVYQGGGAVYGHKGKEAYQAMEEQARKKGKGIWSDKSRETAAEYKARIKAEGS